MDRFKTRSRQLRRAQTNAEAKLWRALRGRQLEAWKFRRQHQIDRFVVDFVCLDQKLVVEIEGPTHFSGGANVRDAARTRVLENLGFHVVRATNADVYDNLAGVIELILSELGRR